MRQLRWVESLESRAMLAGTLTQVSTFETWNANPRIVKSTDPAGITYHAPSGSLFISDSEINEISQFSKKNVFQTNLTGTAVLGEFWPGKNKEPTGIVYNEADGFFYITNDDDKTITRFDQNLDTEKGRVGTSSYGIDDPEDITADPSGTLYVVSGHPPLVAVFDAKLKYIRQFSTSSRMKDAEGIAYDTQSGNLLLVSASDKRIFEYTTSGQFVEEYRIDGLSPKPQTPQGLAFAPCTDNSFLQCLFIADGGIDNKPDGRIYEVRVGAASVPKPLVANGQTVTTNEDVALAIQLTGSDANGKTLSFILDSSPSHGSLTGTAPNIQYVPDSNYHGPDSFRFKVNNGSVTSAAATISINVAPVNDDPVANAQFLATSPDTSVKFTLNGSDVDGDSLSYSIVKSPASGTLSGTAPNLTYQPKSGFVGNDSFDYQVQDPSGRSSRGTVTVEVLLGGAKNSLSFQDKVFPTTSYLGTQDTKIRGDDPTRSNGTSSTLEIDGKPDIATLLKWDIRQIPIGSLIQSATITINVVKTSVDEFQLYELLRSWDEKTATYLQSATGLPWQVAGAQGGEDRGKTVLGTVTAPKAGTVTITLNSSGIAVVQGWVNDPTRNRGLTFQNYADPSTDDLDFSSREAKDVFQRPKLTVEYQSTAASSLAVSSLAHQTNLANPYDVNADSNVSTIDALVVVNRLNQGGEAEQGRDQARYFPDTTSDGLITPLDALLVINLLNQLQWDALAVSVDDIEDEDADEWLVPLENSQAKHFRELQVSVADECGVSGQRTHAWEELAGLAIAIESETSNEVVDSVDLLFDGGTHDRCEWGKFGPLVD